MLKNLTKLKKLIGKVFLVLGIVALSLFSRINLQTVKSVYALNKEDVSSDLLTVPNFYSTSSSNITSSSYWSTVVPNDEDNSSNFKRGIVNVEKIDSTIQSDKDSTDAKTDGTIVDNLWSNFGLFTSPGKVSSINIDSENTEGINNYLMINAYNFAGHIGYKSDNFTLQKSSYYKIAVTLKTINETKEVDVKANSNDELTTETRISDAKASIYLEGISDTTANTSFELINTNNTWKTYYFYVNTSSFSSEESISVQLYLGSKSDSCQGAVFFSEVKIEQYSESEYNKEVTPSLADKTNIHTISLNNSYIYDFVSNASFENQLTDWTTIGSANNGDIFATIIDTTSTGYLKGNSKYPAIPANNNSNVSNINALAIYSKPNNGTSTYYGVESSSFTIKQYGLYRLSLWTYSNSESANGANITLYDIDNAAKTKSQSISTSADTSNTLSNNWRQYEFYIQGNALRDCNLKLQLTIGNIDSKDSTVNYAMFDDIRIQEVTFDQFSKGSSDSNTLNLTATQSSDYLISNSTFDNVKNNAGLPLSPDGWTLSGKTDNVFAGIVNTNSTSFANNYSNYAKVSNIINPGKINASSPIDSNNVLMLGTASKNQVISYKTDSTFTLSSNSYYKLSFDVFTQNLTDSTNGANFRIVDSNNSNIISIDNIKTNSAWQNYTYYISTGLISKTCNAVISLNKVDAYAYFDNVELSSITSDLYNELVETHNANEFISIDNNYFKNSTAWKTSDNSDSATVGFLTATDYDISVDDENIAFILSDTKDVEYYITSADSISINSNSYYKFSAYINTRDIRKINSDNNDEYGASFYVSYNNTNDGIENITTDANSFVKYTIYLASNDSTSVNLKFGLGSNGNKVSGIAYFTKLEIVKFENEDAMNEDKDANNSDYYKFINAVINNEEEPDNDNTTENVYTASPNWFAISSLITAAALLVAIAAFFIRQINFKKKHKKVSTDYDRRKTLDKQYDAKERIDYRNQLINDLEQELSEIKESTAKVTKEYNEKLSNLKDSADQSSESLKKQLQALEQEQLEISKEHNKNIAKDKLHASKEDDLIYNEKISNIEKQQNSIKKKIKQIEKTYDKEKQQLDDITARSNKRQEDILNEIDSIKQEIQSINEELTKK